MNIILILAYFVFAVTGSTLIKLGASETLRILFTLPIVNMKFTIVSLIGFISYGISFVVYTILLSRFDLSFISPLTVGITYVLLMIVSVIIFKEQFTLIKIIGSSLILIGVLMMTSK